MFPNGDMVLPECMLNYFSQSNSDPMDHSPPGSSIHEIVQARILEWAAMPPLQGIFLIQGSNLRLLRLLHWQADSLPLSHLGSLVISVRQCGKPCDVDIIRRPILKMGS